MVALNSSAESSGPDLQFHPLTAERWRDFTALFGRRGACGGCWCMWWRLSQREFEARKGEKNRRAMHRLVKKGSEPGILAYVGRGAKREAIGWCAVAPRSEYPRLDRSRILKPVDDEPVWSVVCLFVAREWRRRGVSTRLLEAACEHVRARGGRIVEGYAVEPKKKGGMPDVFAFHGPAAAYAAAGFTEAARRSPTRPIMRRLLD